MNLAQINSMFEMCCDIYAHTTIVNTFFSVSELINYFIH